MGPSVCTHLCVLSLYTFVNCVLPPAQKAITLKHKFSAIDMGHTL